MSRASTRAPAPDGAKEQRAPDGAKEQRAPDGAAARDADLSLGPLPGYLGYKLRQAQAASFRHLDRIAGAGTLSPGRFSLLAVIDANPGATQARIARSFGLDKSTLSPVVDQLVTARLVARARSKSDGRAYALSLTPAGRRALDKRRAQIEEQEALLAATLTAAERRQLMALLDRLVAALDAADVDGAEISPRGGA